MSNKQLDDIMNIITFIAMAACLFYTVKQLDKATAKNEQLTTDLQILRADYARATQIKNGQ